MDIRLVLIFTLLLGFSMGSAVHAEPEPADHESSDSVKFDLSQIDPGAYASYMTEGLSVAIYHRTAEEINGLMSSDGHFSDPNSENNFITPPLKYHRPIIHFNADWVKSPVRSKRPEFFVFIDLAPENGCVLKMFSNDDSALNIKTPEGLKRGFIDPCHGIFYDLAGRVFDHPKARNNLYVPNYRFISDTAIELLPEKTITEKSLCDLLAVVDGDTLQVMCDDEEHMVHLHGVVAPQLVSSGFGICRNHPMAEKSKKALEMFLPSTQYPGLVVNPTGELVDGEVDAVVRVSSDYEEQIKMLYNLGPVYAMKGIDQGLSFDQYVFGYAALTPDHPQADHFESVKVNFLQVADTNKTRIHTELGMPVPRKPKEPPEVCKISPIEWANMPVTERCEIQTTCENSSETWVSRAYKITEWFFRLVF